LAFAGGVKDTLIKVTAVAKGREWGPTGIKIRLSLFQGSARTAPQELGLLA
jgi:hypothetical protein